MDWFCFSFLTIILLIFIYKTETFGGCVCVEEFANGLNLPVLFVNANDGSNRIFVGELKGVVHIFYANGTKLPDPFIDVTSRVEKLDKVTESGLSSMAFHPNFTSNGLFYMVVATKTKYFDRNVNHYSNLFEFKVSATDGNKADQNYSRLLLKFDQPVSAHNMDQLLFGIDNYLYVFIGDGGMQTDPFNWAQNMNRFHGKILRIDVDSRTDNLPYGIPQDNPFNDGSYPKPEIYAVGLRNPWRAGMDPGDRDTGEGRGRIIFGDVGQGTVEELDQLEKGANYGWNIYEGTQSHCSGSKCLRGPGNFTAPIYEYARSTKLGKSVIGGQFYRGCQSPALNGIYFWGDFDSGLLFRLKENKDTGTWENKEVDMCDSNVCKYPLQSNYVGGITSFGFDEEGEVYMLSSEGRNPYTKKGQVYRIVEPSQPGDPEPCRVSASRGTTESKLDSQTPSGNGDLANNLDNGAHENLSPPDSSDSNIEIKMKNIEDIFKKGTLDLKEKLAKFLGKLLARLYNSDFSSQDEDSVPQA